MVESIIAIWESTTDQVYATHFAVLSIQQKKLVELYMKKNQKFLHGTTATLVNGNANGADQEDE